MESPVGAEAGREGASVRGEAGWIRDDQIEPLAGRGGACQECEGVLGDELGGVGRQAVALEVSSRGGDRGRGDVDGDRLAGAAGRRIDRKPACVPEEVQDPPTCGKGPHQGAVLALVEEQTPLLTAQEIDAAAQAVLANLDLAGGRGAEDAQGAGRRFSAAARLARASLDHGFDGQVRPAGDVAKALGQIAIKGARAGAVVAEAERAAVDVDVYAREAVRLTVDPAKGVGLAAIDRFEPARERVADSALDLRREIRLAHLTEHPNRDGRIGIPEAAGERTIVGVDDQDHRTIVKRRHRDQRVAIDPGMAAADRARQTLAQRDPRQLHGRSGAGPGGRSATGTEVAATGRARLEAGLAAASTRGPAGKTTSILPAPGEPATTPTPKLGCATRSPGA